MNYTKQNFVDGQTLKADHLNHIEDGIYNLSTNGGGGVSSWNDLTDKPFGYEEKKLVCCENVTVEISEYPIWEETYYQGFFPLGEFGTAIPDSKGYIREFYVTSEDTVKVTFNGVVYEVKPIEYMSGDLCFGNTTLSYNSFEPENEELPFFIRTYQDKMEILTTADYVGSNTLTCTCEKVFTNTIEDKFIPDTIVREHDLIFKYVNTFTIINAEIGMRTAYGFYTGGQIVMPYYTVVGKYVDSDGLAHIIPVKARLSQESADSATWLFTFELENEIEYDLQITVCSNYQCRHVGM